MWLTVGVSHSVMVRKTPAEEEDMVAGAGGWLLALYLQPRSREGAGSRVRSLEARPSDHLLHPFKAFQIAAPAGNQAFKHTRLTKTSDI